MTLPRLLSACLAFLAAILACVLWIDRPLARLLAEFRFGHEVFTNSAVTQPVLPGLAYAGLLLGVGYLIAGKRLPKWVEAAMLAGIALLIGLWLAHYVLKPAFGRTLPSHYLHSGHYGFRWLRGSASSAFPSGHATQAAAMLTVLWRYYPRWRWLYGVAMVVLAIGLMLGQWHYLGDIVAGTALGIAAGSATMAIWRKASERWRVLRA